MAKFLNTKGLSEWIPKIIEETERELVIITPYMQLSDNIYENLVEANARGVETIIIYRENKLSENDRAKLLAIDNLNLFHHPNLHAKCYYNEKYLLIASMNLYAYSEKNNREMGVLLHKVSLDNNRTSNLSTDDDDIFKDAVDEIRNIIKSSEFEKKSRETMELGFEMDIIKNDKEKAEEYCKIINKHFIHKKFEALKLDKDYGIVCLDYFDRIDVYLEHRIVFQLNLEEEHLKNIFTKFKPKCDEFMFPGFKFYWNEYPKDKVYLYKDNKFKIWETNNEAEKFEKIQQGINNFMQLIKPLLLQKNN